MRGPRPRRALPVAVLITAVTLGAGCGSPVTGPAVGAGGESAPSGSLAVAIPSAPNTLDPLAATSPTDRLVVRQLDEPLVARLSGPYGDVRRVPGLALSVRPSENATLWRLRLREGVRFQDGAHLNASAVLANVERWRTTAAGQALLPDLEAADAPRPNLVRLILSRPDRAVPAELAAAQLGIVSPRALRPRSGTAAILIREGSAGTGPFEVRAQQARQVVIARNTAWWGTRRGLGPALDQVGLRVVPSAVERVRLLRRGDVEVAEGLADPQADALRRDPLLTGISGPGGSGVGLERSVRGIDSAAGTPQLSSVWLTQIGTG